MTGRYHIPSLLPVVLSAAALSAMAACGDSDDQPVNDSDPRSTDTEDAGSGTSEEGDTASEKGSDSHEDTETFIALDTDYEIDPNRLTLGAPCPLETYLGGITVEMNADLGYTGVDGAVLNGTNPSTLLEEVLTRDDCRMLRRPRLVCDIICEPGTTCGRDLTCVEEPRGQDLGIVAIQGLSKTVIIKPDPSGNSYFYTNISHPGFTPNEVIRLTSTGGYLEPLELFGVGVEPLLSPEDKWILEEGMPLEVTWTPPGDGAVSRMKIEITVDQHGLTPLTLACDLPDTGSAAISSELVDYLIQAGVTGFPSCKMYRRTVDSTSSNKGCADFSVTSVATADIEVTGHIPCARQVDCPSPLTCNEEIQQCQ